MVQGQPAKANGDTNQNGVPNLIDWLMGQNPGAGPDFWTARVPLSKKPFIRMDAGADGLRFIIYQLRSALGHPTVIKISENLIDWRPVTGRRWEALQTVYFPLVDGCSRSGTSFHPVFIPLEGNTASSYLLGLGAHTP